MAALLIAMSIMAVMMTVALPTWRQMSIREREAELVFRGEQYARALVLFQSKNGPGTAAPTFDLLVEQHYLRKKYKDPITNDEFVPILLTAAQAGPGGQPGATPGSAASPGGRGGAAPADSQTSVGGPLIPTTTSGPAAGTAPGSAAAGGIVGVTSKSKEQSIRLYKGRNHYNEWQFMPVPRVTAAGQGGQGAGGARGAQNPFGGAGSRQGNPGPGGRGPFGGTNPPAGGQPANPSGAPGTGQPAPGGQLPLPAGPSGR